jgi:hypothetical protein
MMNTQNTPAGSSTHRKWAQHPDERLAASLTNSFQNGHDEGLLQGYTSGWRKGLFDGAVVGLVLGALMTIGALHMGLLAGA